MKRATWKHLALSAALCLAAGTSSVQSSLNEHERLRIRNNFKTAEEVVAYYCARDASGFVWSGMLDSERRAFTLWAEAPQQDSFYIARRYEVKPAERAASDGSRVSVEVRYELTAIGDAHGTRTPATPTERIVTFDLKKADGAWKIERPLPSEIAPVVLEAKFPTAGG